MKAFVEIVKINVTDIVTTSAAAPCAPVTLCEDEFE